MWRNMYFKFEIKVQKDFVLFYVIVEKYRHGINADLPWMKFIDNYSCAYEVEQTFNILISMLNLVLLEEEF